MRLGFIGDIHGDLPRLKRYSNLLRKRGADKVYALGDISLGYIPHYNIGILNETLDGCILGNHDQQDDRGNLIDFPVDYTGLTVPIYPRGTFVNPDNTDVSVLFVGGGESIDRHRRIHGISWWPGETIKPRDIDAIDEKQKCDIIASHTLPKSYIDGPFQNTQKVYPLEGFGQSEKALDVLFGRLQDEGNLPKFWVGCHWHNHAVDNYNGVTFIVLDRIDDVDGINRDGQKGCCAIVNTETWRYSLPRLRTKRGDV